MTPVMLVLAMSAGQGPATPPVAPGSPYPVIRSQAVGVPAVLPGTLPTIPAPGAGRVVVQQPMPMEMPMAEEKKEEIEGDKGEEAAPPVYLLERSLRETWLGKTMADHNLRLYGWTAMSYTVGTTRNSNAPMFFNDRPNHF